MSLLARFVGSADPAERRGSDRRELRLSITAALPDEAELAATIHDLSESGFLLETQARLSPDQPFQLFLPLAGAVEATVVWNTEHFYGCQFREKVARAAISAALLKSEPKRDDERTAAPDLVSQLRDINERIEEVGLQLDRTIEQLGAMPPRLDPDTVIAAALPKSAIPAPPEPVAPLSVEPKRYYEQAELNESDSAQWVVIGSLILAGLAALLFIAALLGLPLAP